MVSQSTGSIPAITLIKGTEEALVRRESDALRKRVLRAFPSAEPVTFSALTYEAGELATHASGSLFADQKLLIITDLGDMSDAFAKDFEAYLASPLDEVWVIALQGKGKRGIRIFKALAQRNFPTIDCKAPKGVSEKAALVAAEVRGAGGSIDSDAAAELVAALGDDLEEMLASAGQLVADSGGHITAAAVHTFHRGRVETKPWDVAQALADRDFIRAMVLVRQAFTVNIPPVVLVAAMAGEFRTMAKVKVPGISDSEVGGAPWQVKNARRRAYKWSESALGSAITLIANTDAAVKGESRAPESAVELCIMDISRLN